MAFNPNIIPFLVPFDQTAPDLGVEASVVLSTIGDISSDFTGGGGTMILKAIGNLAAVQNITSNGLVVITDFGDTATTRLIQSAGGSIHVDNGDGVGGNIDVAVVNDTSVQRILHAYNGEFPTTTSGTTINWIPAGGIGITITPTVGHSESVDIQLSSTGSGGGSGTVTSVAISSPDLTVGGSPITLAGTITLALNTVPTTKGGTGLTSYTVGDILYCSATNVLTKLGIGSNGQFLTVAGGIPTWATEGGLGTVTSVGLVASGGILQSGTASPITTTGTYNLTLDGSGASNAIMEGDLLRGSVGAYAALPIGTNGQLLTCDGNTFNWVTPTPDPGNADSGILGAGGALFVAMPDITETTVIVASSLGSNAPSPIIPAAGPLTVLMNVTTPPLGFTITGDGAADANKGVGWTIDGGGGGGGSITSIVPDGGILATNPTGPAVTLTLTGSGASNAIIAGDLLLGTPGAYAAIPINTTPGLPLITTGTTAVWGGGMNMNTNLIQGIDYLSINGRVSAPTNPVNGAAIYADVNTGALRVTSTLTASAAANVVTALPSGYGVPGSILFGSAANNTYQALAPTTNGFVLTLAGGVPTWAVGSSTTVKFGEAQFGTIQSGSPNFVIITVSDTAVGVGTHVVVSLSASTANYGPPGNNDIATGPFSIAVTPGTGFTITSYNVGVPTDVQKWINYSYNV